ncbi:MAG: lasso peptide biosynthesis B2 protein [Pseudomonadota bacterium]
MNEKVSLWRRARKGVAKITARQALAAVPLFLALGAARAAALILPFRVYAPLFGDPSPPTQSISPTPSNGVEDRREGARARHVGRTIETVARFTPWNSNCLAQTIVAAVCLRLLKIAFQVRFGVAQSQQAATPIEAHSWVMSGAFPVTGYRESLGMTCVQTFRYRSE